MARARQRNNKTEPAESGRDDASLYPLDPETAIKAIMEAGPHPKQPKEANRRAKKPRNDRK